MPESSAKRSPMEREVAITRSIGAPRELVFEAWTDAKRLAEWWGPRGFTNPVCELDARPGGALRIHMLGPDGALYPNRGVVRELLRPERFVFTCILEGRNGEALVETLNTVTFEQEGGGTKLTLRARVVYAAAEAAPMLDGMDEGWSQTLDRLAGEAEVRALIDARIQAVRAKDADAAMAHHREDAVLFDVVNPLRYIGAGAGKKRAQEWFASFKGPLGYEIGEPSVTAADDVAFSHGLNHVQGSTAGGSVLDMWWRATVCYRKIEGRWTIVHEHSSVPLDTATSKASLNLKP